jgi:REP element-mobilizing transposase RayT
MASYISNLVHFVWATHERRPAIKDSWKDRLYKYIAVVLRNKKARLICTGGIEDHIHVYASLPSSLSIAVIANAMKANSSRWVHQNFDRGEKFQWQKGYGAFTVSKSAEQNVIHYIQNQEIHHRQRTFHEEFVSLLEKHGIDYEERYLWV